MWFSGTVGSADRTSNGPYSKVGFRVAYDAMWLHGIAVAPDAVQDFGFGLDRDIDANENGIFHGLFLGLDMRW